MAEQQIPISDAYLLLRSCDRDRLVESLNQLNEILMFTPQSEEILSSNGDLIRMLLSLSAMEKNSEEEEQLMSIETEVHSGGALLALNRFFSQLI